jgi:hypothetical protein
MSQGCMQCNAVLQVPVNTSTRNQTMSQPPACTLPHALTFIRTQARAPTCSRTDGIHGLEQCASSTARKCSVAGQSASPAAIPILKQRTG